MLKNNTVYQGSAFDLLKLLPDESVDMIYTDPPFGTGNTQSLQRKQKGKVVSKVSYNDSFADYLSFLVPHLHQFQRVLKETGTMYLHLDWRWVHYVKVKCDEIFGHNNFMNEIVWSYNFGGRGKDRWPTKHDTILVYTKDMGKHIFNWDTVDRIPYVAPEMQFVGRTKAAAEARISLGQVPTDVWNMPIIGTAAKERCGYPTQKPVNLVKRTITASSPQGGLVLDPFAGSGTTIEASLLSGRDFIVCDESSQAIDTMKKRFSNSPVLFRDLYQKDEQ
jgi:site-specific DNA-methyltransferase (adenine-specific)